MPASRSIAVWCLTVVIIIIIIISTFINSARVTQCHNGAVVIDFVHNTCCSFEIHAHWGNVTVCSTWNDLQRSLKSSTMGHFTFWLSPSLIAESESEDQPESEVVCFVSTRSVIAHFRIRLRLRLADLPLLIVTRAISAISELLVTLW